MKFDIRSLVNAKSLEFGHTEAFRHGLGDKEHLLCIATMSVLTGTVLIFDAPQLFDRVSEASASFCSGCPRRACRNFWAAQEEDQKA